MAPNCMKRANQMDIFAFLAYPAPLFCVTLPILLPLPHSYSPRPSEISFPHSPLHNLDHLPFHSMPDMRCLRGKLQICSVSQFHTLSNSSQIRHCDHQMILSISHSACKPIPDSYQLSIFILASLLTLHLSVLQGKY